MSRKSASTDVVRRRRVTFVTMLVAAFVVPAAIAYACNPQAHVALDKTSYQPGSSITVYGSYFPGNVNVTVSGGWGASTGVTTSPGGGFTATLPGPSTPGNYSVSATRATGGYAVASFSVAAPAPAPAAQPSTPAASAPAATAKSAPGFKSPSVRGSEAPASAERTNPPAGSDRTAASNGGNIAPSTNNVTSSAGQQVFSGSTAQAAPTQSFAPTQTAAAPARSSSSRSTTAAAAPSPQAALSDLFSSYQPGRTPSLTGSASGAPAGGAGSGLGLGIGLLAFGMFALVAGLTAAEVRRRRPA